MEVGKENGGIISILFVSLILCLAACQLFKNVKTTSDTEEQLSKLSLKSSSDSKYNAQSAQHFMEWKLDSLDKTYLLQIWPKGEFSFSPEGVFKGQAEKLMLSTYVKQSAAALTLKDSLSKVKNEQHNMQQLDTLDKTKVKKKTRTEVPAFWLMIGLLMLLAIGLTGFWFYKKK